MRISEIVTRLRSKLPNETWANRIYGVAEFEQAIREHRSAFPALFVTYKGSSASNIGDRNTSTLLQDVTETIDIFLMLDNKNTNDITGLNAQDKVHNIRKSLLLIILYYNIDVYDSSDQGFQYNEFRFTGDEPFAVDSERYIHKFTFDINFNLSNLNQGIGSHNPETLNDLITMNGTLKPTFFENDSQPAQTLNIDFT